MILGKQSIQFEKPPYIQSYASIVGQKEADGPLGQYFDMIAEDPMVGAPNWEEAESALQKQAAGKALEKAALQPAQIRYLFCGDLLGQIIASSFGMLNFQIPMFGLYGACSTAGESLSLAAMTVAAGYADHAMAVTSSHFASAEKRFRYPLEYANQRPLSTTWTVTGSGAFIVGTKGNIKITGITTGKMVDYGVKDSMNMGAAMAPAAADTIYAQVDMITNGFSAQNANVDNDLYASNILTNYLSFGSSVSMYFTSSGYFRLYALSTISMAVSAKTISVYGKISFNSDATFNALATMDDLIATGMVRTHYITENDDIIGNYSASTSTISLSANNGINIYGGSGFLDERAKNIKLSASSSITLSATNIKLSASASRIRVPLKLSIPSATPYSVTEVPRMGISTVAAAASFLGWGASFRAVEKVLYSSAFMVRKKFSLITIGRWVWLWR